MASTFQVLLVGGPCDGQTKELTSDQLKSNRTFCRGDLYLYQSSLATIRQPWVFEWAPLTQEKGKSGSTAHVTQAWSRWMKALGHTGPRSHRRVVTATARINRIARKR